MGTGGEGLSEATVTFPCRFFELSACCILAGHEIRFRPGHRGLCPRALGGRARPPAAPREPRFVLPGFASAGRRPRRFLSLRFVDRGGFPPCIDRRSLPRRRQRHLDHRGARGRHAARPDGLDPPCPGGLRPDAVGAHARPLWEGGRVADDGPRRLVHDRSRRLADGRGRALSGSFPRHRPGPEPGPRSRDGHGLLRRRRSPSGGQNAHPPVCPPRRRCRRDGRVSGVADLMGRRARRGGRARKGSLLRSVRRSGAQHPHRPLFRPGLDDLADRLAEDAGGPQRSSLPPRNGRRGPPPRPLLRRHRGRRDALPSPFP